MSDQVLAAAGRSHTGRVRDHNEDAASITEIVTPGQSYLLWLVADGMGGGVKGEVASATARDQMSASLRAITRATWISSGQSIASTRVTRSRQLPDSISRGTTKIT